MKIVLASSNPGKLAEISELLASFDIELIAQSALDIDDAEETGGSFVENAILKARHAARKSGLPALADDSGLCVDALDGAPGLLSARYSGRHGDDVANNAKLLHALAGVAESERTAYFHCTLVLMQSTDDPAPLIAEGRWHGRILSASRGTRGFGYDPLFFDAQLGMGAGDMENAEKNRISHRGKAMLRLRELLHTR